ncbi:TolC family protein [Acidobacteriota bacterium]
MKKTGKIFLVLGLIFALEMFSFSQEKLTLSLEDSIRLALSQNPYQLAAEEQVKAAESKVRQAVSGFLPSLNGQGLITLDEKLFELEFPSMIPGQPPERVKIDFTRDYQFSLNFSLPLFMGGRLRSGFKQAKYNLSSAGESLRQSQHTTVFSIKRAFFGYLLAKEFVQVSEEAVEVSEKHYQNVKSLYEVGLASKFDLLRSEVQVANLKPQLIRARNNLKISALSLKTLLGMELSKPVEFIGDLTYEDFEVDLEESLRRALDNRPELSQIRYQKQMAGELLKITKASRLPTLAVSGTYNFWAEMFNFKKDAWQNHYAVNLVLTVPIFNGFSVSAQAAESRAKINEIDLNRRGLEDMVRFEVRQAVLKLKEAQESLHSQEKNVEQAQESLRIAELNFSEGLVTSLDVSTVQAALSQAKINYSQALYDYSVSQAELDKAIGVGWEN